MEILKIPGEIEKYEKFRSDIAVFKEKNMNETDKLHERILRQSEKIDELKTLI